MRCKKIIAVLFVCISIVACSSSKVKNPYAEKFEAQQVRSILVVPAVNHSVDVDAAWVLLSTLPEAMAETGYYIFPVNTVKVVLEHEGLYEADMVHSLPPEQLANLFGADAVLYISIENWESQYVLLQTTTKVSFRYRVVSRSGNLLWAANNTVVETLNDNSNDSGGFLVNLVVDVVSAAIQRAAPDYRPLALKANREVFLTGSRQWPRGPYRKKGAFDTRGEVANGQAGVEQSGETSSNDEPILHDPLHTPSE